MKEKQLADEISDVKDLKAWERQILVENDPKYDPDDNSEDEEQVAMKAARKKALEDQKAAEEAAAAESKKRPGRK